MRVLLILLMVGLFSCKSSKPTTDKVEEKSTTIAFAEFSAGTNSGFTTKSNLVISSQEKLNEVWKTANERFLDAPECPKFDFNAKTILFVARGQQTSGGYDIKIEMVTEGKDDITVFVIESTPGNSCATADVITFPYQMVEIPKSNKKVSFQSTESIYDCD